MKNTFKEGQMVLERIRPNQKLIVFRCIDNMYYCWVEENPKKRQLVYLERELMPIQPSLPQSSVA